MSLDLDQVVADAQTAFASVEDNASLENEKARFLGKSGVLTDLLKGLGKLDPQTRKSEGARINLAKSRVEAALNDRRQALADALMNARLAAEAIDVTLPGRDVAEGSLHPVMNTWERVAQIFGSIGFDVADGGKLFFTALEQTRKDFPFYKLRPSSGFIRNALLFPSTMVSWKRQKMFMLFHLPLDGATSVPGRAHMKRWIKITWKMQ